MRCLIAPRRPNGWYRKSDNVAVNRFWIDPGSVGGRIWPSAKQSRPDLDLTSDLDRDVVAQRSPLNFATSTRHLAAFRPLA